MLDGKPDWKAIQQEYEAGGSSLQKIAEKYGVAKTTVYRMAQKWNGTERNTEKSGTERNVPSETGHLHLVRGELHSPPTAIEGASLGLEALVTFLREGRAQMDLADHVKAANALSQYNRIIINAPPDEQEQELEDLSGFNEDELRIYAEFQERAKKRA